MSVLVTGQSSEKLRLLSTLLQTRHVADAMRYLTQGGEKDAVVFTCIEGRCMKVHVSPQDYTGGLELRSESLLAHLCVYGPAQTIEALIDAGADLEKSTGCEFDVTSPLIVSACLGRVSIVKLLLDRGALIHAFNDEALKGAAQSGELSTVVLLCSKGADVKAFVNRNGSIDTALFRAAYMGHLEVAQFLHSKGAKLTAGDSNLFSTALHRASYGGKVATLGNWLIQTGGLTVDSRNSGGATPLMSAAEGDKIDTAKWLLQHGAAVSAVNRNGFTALDYAAGFGSVSVLLELVAAGADITGTGRMDSDPNACERAAHNGKTSCVSALMMCPRWKALSRPERIKAESRLLHAAVDVATIRAVMQCTLDPAVLLQNLDYSGGTALHCAVLKAKIGGVHCALIEAGVDCTARNDAGVTAAEMAREMGQELAAKLLERAARQQTATGL